MGATRELARQRRATAIELAAEGWSQPRIARHLGVSQKSVWVYLRPPTRKRVHCPRCDLPEFASEIIRFRGEDYCRTCFRRVHLPPLTEYEVLLWSCYLADLIDWRTEDERKSRKERLTETPESC